MQTKSTKCYAQWAEFKASEGQIWPADRMMSMPALEKQIEISYKDI